MSWAGSGVVEVEAGSVFVAFRESGGVDSPSKARRECRGLAEWHLLVLVEEICDF